MSVSEDLLCSFELLKPLDGAALKQEMTKSKRKRYVDSYFCFPSATDLLPTVCRITILLRTIRWPRATRLLADPLIPLLSQSPSVSATLLSRMTLSTDTSSIFSLRSWVSESFCTGKGRVLSNLYDQWTLVNEDIVGCKMRSILKYLQLLLSG